MSNVHKTLSAYPGQSENYIFFCWWPQIVIWGEINFPLAFKILFRFNFLFHRCLSGHPGINYFGRAGVPEFHLVIIAAIITPTSAPPRQLENISDPPVKSDSGVSKSSLKTPQLYYDRWLDAGVNIIIFIFLSPTLSLLYIGVI